MLLLLHHNKRPAQYMRLAKQFNTGSAAAIPDDLRHLK
jgi:hypothetical protein